MLTIILGVAVFVFVIVTLVVVLMIAKSKLVVSGDVTITINDDPDKAIVTAGGRHPAQHTRGAQDLHPLGVRGQGNVRRVQALGPRGRWRVAAD